MLFLEAVAMKKNRILILGGNGFLGSCIFRKLNNTFLVFRGIRSNSNVDDKHNSIIIKYTDNKKLIEVVRQVQPDVIINTIGIANVDACELNKKKANEVMIENLYVLCEALNCLKIPIVHISTDQLYSDLDKEKFTEDDQTSPCNNYGSVKLAAEQLLLSEYDQSIILRTNFFGVSNIGRRSQVDNILYELEEFGGYKGFFDVVYTPVHTSILAEVVSKWDRMQYSSIYNISCDEIISKYEFAQLICKQFGIDQDKVTPVSVDTFNFHAKRSKNMALCNKKIKSLMPEIDFSITHSLDIFLKERVLFSEQRKQAE